MAGVGVERDGAGIAEARRALAAIPEGADPRGRQPPARGPPGRRAAGLRTESRGAHHRRDHPTPTPARRAASARSAAPRSTSRRTAPPDGAARWPRRQPHDHHRTRLRPPVEGAPIAKLRERAWAAREALGARAVILGHHYQKDEVIEFADVTGGSFLLARRGAAATEAELIVFLGVYFMAEAADILKSPGQTVVLPDLGAAPPGRCADMFTVRKTWDQ